MVVRIRKFYKDITSEQTKTQTNNSFKIFNSYNNIYLVCVIIIIEETNIKRKLVKK